MMISSAVIATLGRYEELHAGGQLVVVSSEQ
jgi:hypothetical protein